MIVSIRFQLKGQFSSSDKTPRDILKIKPDVQEERFYATPIYPSAIVSMIIFSDPKSEHMVCEGFFCATLGIRGCNLSDAFTSVMPGARTSKHVNGLAKMIARMKSGLFQAFQLTWSSKSQ